jgi:hypothetical protein
MAIREWDHAMAHIVIDDELAEQIRNADEPVGLIDKAGMPVGICKPIPLQPHIMYSPEYIEQRRTELEPIRKRAREHPEECKSLKEIMASLHRIAGESS